MPRRRFEREAQSIAALSHPHICALFDVGSAPILTPSGEPVQFLVMEFLEGETLAEAPAATSRCRSTRCSASAIADRRRARQGASQGHRASRLEARQHHADGGRAPSCSTSVSRRPLPAVLRRGRVRQRSPDLSPSSAACSARLIHVARASGRKGRRSPQRSVRVRHDRLRDGDGEASVRGEECGQPDGGDSRARASAVAPSAAARAADAGSHRDQMSGQGSRGAMAERRRRHARADLGYRCRGANDSAHDSRCARDVA